MLEHKHKGILSLNLKKLPIRADGLKIISILQNEMLLLMLLCKRALKQKDNIPKHGNTINNSFLGTVCSDILCEIAYFHALIN